MGFYFVRVLEFSWGVGSIWRAVEIEKFTRSALRWFLFSIAYVAVVNTSSLFRSFMLVASYLRGEVGNSRVGEGFYSRDLFFWV